MKNYIIEGVVTALSSITHNGGEKNGNVTQLRREKFVQPNGKVIEIPLISGNSIRGKLRDIAAMELLTKENGEKIKVDADVFNLLFSGGSLESTGDSGINLERIKQLRNDFQIISVFGCSNGNAVLSGKLDIGKMIPIAKETLHLIPEKFHNVYSEPPKSVWEYCQLEMYTRKDDTKDNNKDVYRADLSEETKKSQMLYDTETLSAGTKFYWKILLKDPTDVELGFFLNLLQTWANLSSQVGGNGRIGHGAISLQIKETQVFDSELDFENKEFVTCIENYKSKKKDGSYLVEDGSLKKMLK